MVINIDVKSKMIRYNINTKTVTGTERIVDSNGFMKECNISNLAQDKANNVPKITDIIIEARILNREEIVAI